MHQLGAFQREDANKIAMAILLQRKKDAEINRLLSTEPSLFIIIRVRELVKSFY